MNNPLTRIDPSGNFIFLAIFLGAYIGGINAALQPNSSFGSVLGGMLIGGAAGLAGGGLGNLAAGGAFFGTQAATMGFASGFLSGAAGGFAGGFIGGAGNAWMNGASFGGGLAAGFKAGLIGGLAGGLINGVVSGIRADKAGLDFWSGSGEVNSEIPLSGASSGRYASDAEMRADYNDNVGSVDNMSLDQVEQKLNTPVSLANGNNLSSDYSINNDGLLYNQATRNTAGGITTGKFSGGRLICTRITMAPGLKGYGLNIRNMIFKHEFMHAWHYNVNPALFERFSERATSTYSLAYSKVLGPSWMIQSYRNNIGLYPSAYSWRNFNKIIPLWIK